MPDAGLPAAHAIDPAARLDAAAVLRQQGHVDAAVAAYRALLDEHPALFQAHVGLGFCARQRGDWATAVRHLTAALDAAPDDPWVRLDYANIVREHGNVDAAAPVYRALLAEQPEFWQAQAGLGLCLRAGGDPAGAAALLQAAVQSAPGMAWVRLEYANTLRDLRRLDEAEAAYRALLADDKQVWQAEQGLGFCARLRGDRAAALAHFRAATRIAPDEEAAWYELAGEHREQGRLDEARAVLQPLFGRGVAGLRSWLGLGHIERWAGNRAAALDAFAQGFAHHPDWPQFMIEIAHEALALNQGAEADRWLRRAAAVPAVAGQALIMLGQLARGRKQTDAALELFRRAAAQPTAPVAAHTAMVETLADLGRLDAALAALAEADAALGPRPELALARANLLRRTGRRATALALVREAVAAMPAYMPLWFEWFENERLSADFDRIEDCFAAAPIATVHDRAQLHYARGQAAEQRWDAATATAEFEAAVALDPSLSMAHEILARLALLRFDIPAARAALQTMRGLRAADQRRQGLSPHLAHTHIGNFFDEFVMDGPLLAALAEAQALPPPARVGRLAALVRGAPEHTPAAIGLLLALRAAGLFGAGDNGPATIPPRIAQYWNDATLPDDLADAMASWPARNPAHRYQRFDDAAAQAFLTARCTPEVLRAYRRAREPAMKADLFRLAWLFAEGGVYADADDRCLGPVAALLPAGAHFVACQEHFGTLGNNFLAVAPLHPVLGLGLHLAVQAVNRGDDDMVWLATGPGLLTRAVAQTLATSTLLPATWLAGVRILFRHELEQVVATHCDLAYKHSPRHWLRSTFGQPKPPAAPPQKAAP